MIITRCIVGLLTLLLLHQRVDAQVITSTLVSGCSLPCLTPFEQCVVFDGVELCAQVCAPDRCDESAGEVCVLRGVTCDSAPCLPVATCEISGQQVPAATGTTSSSSTGTTDSSMVSDLAECYTVCPLVHAPVCASDGVSYVNECYFERAKCVAERSGSASSLAIVTSTLCASDVALNLAYNPPPPATVEDATAIALAACDQSTDTQCSDLDEPVCTSAGTMRNMCYWRHVRRCQEEILGTATNAAQVELLRNGPCEGDASSSSASDSTAQCPGTCPTASYAASTASSTVCASNGMLFASDCEFRRARCARPLLVGGLTRQPSAASCQSQQ